MTIREEQEQSKLQPYAEAMRYMNNAEGILQQTRKEDNVYLDRKYVRMACGTAYLGVLEAVDKWLQLKDVPNPSKKKRKSIEFYTANVALLDGKLTSELHAAYRVLHIEGYYEGVCVVKVIQGGFDTAYQIIARIKPDVPEEELKQYLDAYTKKKASLWQQLSSLLSL
ncbi:hypothetical protein FACS1894199_10370 [Bacteroidia bacterium]|nr:hypothetical protein FACS1894199_10370 [Bacteroidia bacterium]